MANMPDEKKLIYAEAAQQQIIWVRDCLAYKLWNLLLPLGVSMEEREKTLTVEGSHISKSVRLPVYRFDIGGHKIKLRGNFYDWCVRCWTPTKPFPKWTGVHDASNGCFEGMSSDEAPTSFVVPRQEDVYVAIAWMCGEGFITA